MTLTRKELYTINPNTGTCPTFRSKRDAELTKRLYKAAPVLINEAEDGNPWGVSFSTMLHMSNDSDLFNTREALEAEGFELRGNRFVRGEETFLPLYEAKMFHQFDHRYGSFADSESRSNVQLKNPSVSEYSDPTYIPEPWCWVEEKKVEKVSKADCRWFFGFRNVVRTTDVKTGTFSILPRAGVGHSAPLILKENSFQILPALLSSLNSFVFDFAARQKIGGVNFTYYYLKQLPVHPPERYTPELLEYIVPRVLELTYTAWDLAAFADDVWGEASADLQSAIESQWQANIEATGGSHRGKTSPEWVERSNQADESFPHPPFLWDEARRARLRADLDGLYGHLYGLTREELAYILDTFPIARRRDEEEYGEYRTKRRVLAAYDRLDEHFVDGEYQPAGERPDVTIKLEREGQPSANPFFQRTVLAAEIVHQLHDRPTFGRVKFQKVLYLCEHHSGAADEQINAEYHRMEAGPMDSDFIYSVLSPAEQNEWFRAEKDDNGTTYEPLNDAGGHREYLTRYYSEEQLDAVQKIIDLLQDVDTERCEIVATLYAAWNDLLLQGKEATKENILEEVLRN